MGLLSGKISNCNQIYRFIGIYIGMEFGFSLPCPVSSLHIVYHRNIPTVRTDDLLIRTDIIRSDELIIRTNEKES